MKTRITFMLAGVGKSHIDLRARWIHDFDVRRVEGDGFNFSASLKF